MLPSERRVWEWNKKLLAHRMPPSHQCESSVFENEAQCAMSERF